ncbi:SDR family oxidoreductase [Limibaculum sp. M0105]|uniref:Peroxisomal trans-2-enoyl-CoA reductase n=1 Tax=Thermohalobaculum xanthum TaxID=2753746 RepID=A0A8J7M4K9_9RHOB|nr:SDR family oxidoreductase [Thermohalobaculum xanthum]MBK0398189.1 SDR family oxidoreductase [Thermohalobaculum xanthum]
MTEPTNPEVLRDGLFGGARALVTGAGTGIGRAISLRLCALGMSVTGVARREAPLADTAELAAGLPGGFDFRTCNVRDTDAIEAIVAEAGEGGLDLLVNNAGGQFFAPATGISQKGWNSVIDLNLNAVFAVTKAAYPYLKARKGAVVSISLSGVDRGGMGLAHSIAARAGVLGMTRTLALEWAKDGIRLNCIGPGTVVTSGLADEAARQLLDNLVAATPMGEPTPPEDVAELVAFLASSAGRLMTGQLIQIDGAAHLGAGLHMLSA